MFFRNDNTYLNLSQHLFRLFFTVSSGINLLYSKPHLTRRPEINKNSLEIKTENYKAFLFDMDGLLLDTERICWKCFVSACKKFGHDPDFNIYKNCIGRKAEEGDIVLSEGFGSLIPYYEVKNLWNDLYAGVVEAGDIELKDGVYDFLRNVSDKNKRMAVVTSTGMETALKKLSSAKIIDFFEIVMSGDRAENSKPHPEIYLKAAEQLSLMPSECIVFEDSDNGVIAAHSAGMDVIQIPDMFEPSHEVQRLGHRVTDSLANIFLK